MHNFGRLYRFELKKILCRKLTVIVLTVMFLMTLAVNITEYVAGSKLVSDADLPLVGREIDDALLDEMRAAVSVKTATDDMGQTLVTSAEVLDPAYEHLFKFLKQIGGNESKAYNMTAKKLADTFHGIIDEHLKKEGLSEDEIDYWNARRVATTIPPHYGREGGWGNSLINLYMTNFFIAITVAATLSGTFADEYTLRTDALVFSSNNGKRRLSLIKLLAGLTVGLAEAAIMIIESTAMQFVICGGVDAATSVQLYYGPSVMDMPAKKALLICLGILLLITLFYSAVTICLSQLFRNAIIPMAAMALMMILSMLNPPYRFRVISQAASYLPATFPGSWTFTDYRLVTLFGQQFSILQVMPVLYPLLTILLTLLLYQSYRRTQIGSR